jgi:hypothetical protein
MRPLLPLACALALCAAAADAAAQSLRGGMVSYGRGGGSTELTEPRFALHAGYTVGGTGPSGAYAGARYLLGAHWLRADPSAYASRHGAGEVEGGGGTLYDTGIDVELGWKLGPVRPYWYTGYHYHQQFLEPATVATAGGTVEVPSQRRQSFSRGGGYGVVLLVSGGNGFFAERFRGGGEDGVMEVDAVRFGLRYAW